MDVVQREIILLLKEKEIDQRSSQSKEKKKDKHRKLGPIISRPRTFEHIVSVKTREGGLQVCLFTSNFSKLKKINLLDYWEAIYFLPFLIKILSGVSKFTLSHLSGAFCRYGELNTIRGGLSAWARRTSWATSTPESAQNPARIFATVFARQKGSFIYPGVFFIVFYGVVQ